MPQAARVLSGVLLIFALASASSIGQVPADLFANDTVQRIELNLHSADWARLKSDIWSNQYVPADFTWHGETFRNVGIRSRGHSTRNVVKPGLRVDFDRYTTDGRAFGLKSVVLDNLVQDPSGIHESVAMALYERLGLPATRLAHARLYINGAYAGLYTVVESIDKEMLARVFGAIGDDVQNDGYLYELKNVGEWRFEYLGPSLFTYMNRLEARTHERRSLDELYGPIETLIRRINDTPVAQFSDIVGARFDLAALTRYVAAQNFVAERDGFLGQWGVNNFYLYRLENSDRHVLIPWDADLSFERPDLPIETRHRDNVMMTKLMAIPEYAGLYRDELRRAARMAGEDDWLEKEIGRQAELIGPAMRDDGNRPYSQSYYEAASAAMLEFARQRIAFVNCALDAPACG